MDVNSPVCTQLNVFEHVCCVFCGFPRKDTGRRLLGPVLECWPTWLQMTQQQTNDRSKRTTECKMQK